VFRARWMSLLVATAVWRSSAGVPVSIYHFRPRFLARSTRARACCFAIPWGNGQQQAGPAEHHQPLLNACWGVLLACCRQAIPGDADSGDRKLHAGLRQASPRESGRETPRPTLLMNQPWTSWFPPSGCADSTDPRQRAAGSVALGARILTPSTVDGGVASVAIAPARVRGMFESHALRSTAQPENCRVHGVAAAPRVGRRTTACTVGRRPRQSRKRRRMFNVTFPVRSSWSA
jgi:hypothetical protein